MHLSSTVRLAAMAFGLISLAACSGTAEPAALSAPAGTSVAVAVAPAAPRVAPNDVVVFAAAVTGTVDTSVRWSVREAGGGTIDGTGRYVAPGGAGVFHVEAASVADPSASAAATVTVTSPPPPVVVTVAPATAAVDACRTLNLTATVTGTTNGAVTWSVQEGAAGGTVTPAGLYTAPSNAGVYHLVATSVAAPASVATATVTVTERVLTVQVTPATVSLQAGGNAQFTATVTTTCGSFATAATLDGNGQLVAN
jgi:hypothetical protein